MTEKPRFNTKEEALNAYYALRNSNVTPDIYDEEYEARTLALYSVAAELGANDMDFLRGDLRRRPDERRQSLFDNSIYESLEPLLENTVDIDLLALEETVKSLIEVGREFGLDLRAKASRDSK